MDFSMYLNPAPYTIESDATLPRVFDLYRTMGLRYIPVVDGSHCIVGLITRKELTTYNVHKLDNHFQLAEGFEYVERHDLQDAEEMKSFRLALLGTPGRRVKVLACLACAGSLADVLGLFFTVHSTSTAAEGDEANAGHRQRPSDMRESDSS